MKNGRRPQMKVEIGYLPKNRKTSEFNLWTTPSEPYFIISESFVTPCVIVFGAPKAPLYCFQI